MAKSQSTVLRAPPENPSSGIGILPIARANPPAINLPELSAFEDIANEATEDPATANIANEQGIPLVFGSTNIAGDGRLGGQR